MAELSASPIRSKTLKRIADTLRELQGPMGQIIPGTDLNPYKLLPAADSVENWAYGNLPMAMPPSGTGGYIPIVKTGRKGEMVDLVGTGLGVAPAIKAAERGAENLSTAAVRAITGNPNATPMGVIDEAGNLVPLANIAKIKGIPINEIMFPGRSISGLTAAEKNKLTRFEKELHGSQAVRRREEFRVGGQDITTPTPGLNLISEIALNPEKLVGKRLVPVFGDLSAIGQDVTQIGGVPLSKPVTQQGGRKYILAKPNIQQGNAWASEPSQAGSKNINLGKYEEPTVGVFFGGGPESIDFSHHMAQGFVRQLDALKPSRDAIKQFNEVVRNTALPRPVPGSNKKVNTYPFKNFAGIDSPNIEELMTVKGAADYTPGQLRTAISQATNTAAMRRLGFPVYEDTQRVMSEQGLRPGYAGQTIFEAQPERGLLTPDYTHQSYSAGIPGKYIGGLNINAPQTGVPADLLWPKLFAEQRALKKRDDQILAKMRQSHQGEMFDQEALDNLMAYLNQLPSQ